MKVLLTLCIVGKFIKLIESKSEKGRKKERWNTLRIIMNNVGKINKNSNDEVEMVTYNTYEVTKLIDKITMNIQDEFNGLEYGKVNDEFVLQKIPFGVIFGNVFLRNLGPKINIRFDMIGNVLTNIETEVKPYGINNAYVETRVFIEANARIIIPFVTKNVKITNVIPISINIYQGKVPNGYITSFNK